MPIEYNGFPVWLLNSKTCLVICLKIIGLHLSWIGTKSWSIKPGWIPTFLICEGLIAKEGSGMLSSITTCTVLDNINKAVLNSKIYNIITGSRFYRKTLPMDISLAWPDPFSYSKWIAMWWFKITFEIIFMILW